VVCAVLSSNNEISIPQDTCFAAEVGLAGEIRAISRVEQRIQEAEKLGFKRIILSKFNKISKTSAKIEIIKVGKIEEILKVIFDI
jgi:DNA repair protein RadA/Sms